MSTTFYNFKAEMPCDGCSKAIQRSLTKTFQTELVSADADLGEQSVKVTIKRADGVEPYTYDQIYDAMCKSGKKITKLDNATGSL